MDREYLEDYEQSERADYERLNKRIAEGRFSFKEDRFPQDDRFVKLKRPLAWASAETSNRSRIWSVIPFSSSVIITIPPVSRTFFEKYFFEVSEIPRIIDFIKETGRLQIGLTDFSSRYVGLDHLDPLFVELKPPECRGPSWTTFYEMREVRKANEVFETLANLRLRHLVRQIAARAGTDLQGLFDSARHTYLYLKLGGYQIIEEIENLMVDSPEQALTLLFVYGLFLVIPSQNMVCDSMIWSLGEARMSESLPLVYKPQKIQLPYEVGSFLLHKLTYAPSGIDACKEVMYHYDSCDLQKTQRSLNEAIKENDPDLLNKSVRDLSAILDNVWSDKTILRRTKGLQIGIPLSMAVLGSVAAGPIGAAGGLLAGLGYNVLDRFIDLRTEGLSEKLATLKTKSYQANIYDFKKKYKAKLARP